MIRMKENLPSLVALLASSSTLICCALPALLVLLGAGASLANFITIFPIFIVLSKHKVLISIIATVTLSLAGYLNYKTCHMPCPADPTIGKQCMQNRKRSVYIYIISVFIFIFATIFTYILPRII